MSSVGDELLLPAEADAQGLVLCVVGVLSISMRPFKRCDASTECAVSQRASFRPPNWELGLMEEGAAGRGYWLRGIGAAAAFVSHRSGLCEAALASKHF